MSPSNHIFGMPSPSSSFLPQSSSTQSQSQYEWNCGSLLRKNKREANANKDDVCLMK